MCSISSVTLLHQRKRLRFTFSARPLGGSLKQITALNNSHLFDNLVKTNTYKKSFVIVI